MSKKKDISPEDIDDLLSTIYFREQKNEDRIIELSLRYMRENIKTMENTVSVLSNRLKLLEEQHQSLIDKRGESFERYKRVLLEKLERVELVGDDVGTTTQSNENDKKEEVNIKLLQSLSYTVFDTILFSITKGSAPDFTLISQSALFETVYLNVSRGYDSYLFQEVPVSAKAVIIQGRSILDELRETEERFLDEPDLWNVYAPQIQKWWVDTALPLIFGERDPDWDKVVFPTYDEMQRWKESEFSRRQFFPAVTDLIELAKENAAKVADTFDFKQLLSV